MKRKVMTRKNAPLVLARLAVLISDDDENGPEMVDHLNDWLDDLNDGDVFGTEGQNDPRGDATADVERERDAAIAMHNEESLAHWRARAEVERLTRERDRAVNDRAVQGEENMRLRSERDKLVADLEEEIVRWQTATGLECGGDPGGVTPDMLGFHVQQLERERDEWRDRHERLGAGYQNVERERVKWRSAHDEMKARAENALEELARVRALPELEWAQASPVIAQGLALHAREDQPAAKRMLEVLDKAKTYVGRLKARAEAAEAEVSKWINLESIAQDMVRKEISRREDADSTMRHMKWRAEAAEADNARFVRALNIIENDISEGRPDDAQREAIAAMDGDHPGAALLEERKRIAKVLDTMDVPSEADETEKGRACDFAGRVELLASWGQHGWREYRKTKDSEAALLERFQAAEKVVEAARRLVSTEACLWPDAPSTDGMRGALAAYDAAKEGK